MCDDLQNEAYKTYEANGEMYILLQDISNRWYPLCRAKNQTPNVRKKLNEHNIPVVQIRIKKKHEGLYERSAAYWVVLEKYLFEINKLAPMNIFHNDSSIDGTDETKYGCVFYIIQKYPEDYPSIVKMGKTTKTAEARSRAFYVWNPKVLREFPISSIDEKTIIRMIGGKNKQVGEEEFIVNDIDDMLNRADIVKEMLNYKN